VSIFVRNTGPLIFDPDARVFAADLGADGDRLSGRTVLRRVVEEIEQHLPKRVAIDEHHRARLEARVDRHAPGAREWEEIELVSAGTDAWKASFTPKLLGRHQFTVVAWVDRFASWRHGLERKVQAGNDVHVELLEGALLVDRVSPEPRATIEEAAADMYAAIRALGGCIVKGEVPEAVLVGADPMGDE
jgi:starch synthase (maltosyl-transferring)